VLSRKIEDAVNAAVRAKTPDPVLFIVNLSHFLFSFPATKQAGRLLDSNLFIVLANCCLSNCSQIT
jgi:enolase